MSERQSQRLQFDALVFARDELALIGCNMDRLSPCQVGSITYSNHAITEISVYSIDKFLHYSVNMLVENNQDISLKSVLIRPLHTVPGYRPKDQTKDEEET